MAIEEKVAILDAGSQFGKVIDRRIRELSIYCEVFPLNTSVSDLKDFGCQAIVISGSPGSVEEANAPKVDPDIWQMDVPVLGICYGMQLLNKEMGGEVGKGEIRSDGQFKATLDTQSPLFSELNSSEQLVLLTHGDSVVSVAPCLNEIGKFGELVVAIAHRSKPIYGVQFHPEVDLTECGPQIFKTFLYNVAGLTGKFFEMKDRETKIIEEIQTQVGSSKLMVLVSGGVDSTVLLKLCHKALKPEQIIAFFIDNGFLRKTESENVIKQLKDEGMDVKLIEASHNFYNATTTIHLKHNKGKEKKQSSRVLCQTLNPEEKRKIVGDTFMRIVEEEAKKAGVDNFEDCFLAQGTLRPDLIESASRVVSQHADAIKTHHNDTERVRQLRDKGFIVEPLKDFHKDEVRKLGRQLGLSEKVVMRHPFPGPGLSIRVVCAEEPYISPDFSSTQTILRLIAGYSHSLNNKHALLQKIHAQMVSQEDRDKLENYTRNHALKATLLPIKSVGIQGDARTYSHVVGLSSNSPPDWDMLFFLAKLIPRICHDVNRVTYIFGDPVSDQLQDITPTMLSFNVLSTLRQCDFIANQIMKERNLTGNVSQMPVVLVPLHFDRDAMTREPSCQRCVVLRPFITRDFMTGLAAVPGKHLPEDAIFQMAKEIKQVAGISRVLYDLSSKPPGTTEWE